MTFDAVTELGALLYRVYGEHGKWGRRYRALDKRRRIAARLAEVRRRTRITMFHHSENWGDRATVWDYRGRSITP